MAKYRETSPYGITPVVNSNFLDILVPRAIPITEFDLPYVIEPRYHQRPDLASNVIFKSPKLWWVFAQRNPDVLQDPVFDFTPGTEIYLPKGNALKDTLGV